MKNFQFTIRTVNISNLKPHQVLTDYELDFVPNDYFTGMLKKYELYERPIIDTNGNVITHYAEILAARTNGVEELEVYEVDMDELDMKLFIFSKHTYNVKKVKRSFDMACFYRDYLTENTEGIELAKTIRGNINVKIAYLMGTSESTVKRLLYIGRSENSDFHFNMVEEGNKSLQETRGLVNTEFHGANDDDLDNEDGTEEINSVNSKSGINDSEDNKAAKKKPKVIELRPEPQVKFDDNSIIIGGQAVRYGFEDDGAPFIEVDGKKLRDVQITEIMNRNSSENGQVKTIILTEKKPEGKSIQITLENFGKAA